MRLTGNFKRKFQKKSDFFFSIFSFLRAFVVSSCRKSGFRVFLSLRYGADLGRSRLVEDSSTVCLCSQFECFPPVVTYGPRKASLDSNSPCQRCSFEPHFSKSTKFGMRFIVARFLSRAFIGTAALCK